MGIVERFIVAIIVDICSDLIVDGDGDDDDDEMDCDDKDDNDVIGEIALISVVVECCVDVVDLADDNDVDDEAEDGDETDDDDGMSIVCDSLPKINRKRFIGNGWCSNSVFLLEWQLWKLFKFFLADVVVVAVAVTAEETYTLLWFLIRFSRRRWSFDLCRFLRFCDAILCGELSIE